jgi:hypothetical protein
MKIHPTADELFHADGQTNMTKLMFAFGNCFANASKTSPKKKPQAVPVGSFGR